MENRVDNSLKQLVESLEEQQLPGFMHLPAASPRPASKVIDAVAHRLHSMLFPGYFSEEHSDREGFSYWLGNCLRITRTELIEQTQRALCFSCEKKRALDSCREQAEDIVMNFLARLPELKRALSLDALAAYQSDPAATSVEEAIFCYPGVTAICYHRLAHELYKLGVPLIARVISEKAHSLTGIDIHPGAIIGEGFFIDHGTGVVIGETSVIGRGVRLYQGVTLGARSFPLDSEGNPIKGVERHPIIEDEVTIYAGATILGRITIGRGSQIGGNVWLTESVPAGSRISQYRPRNDGYDEGGGI